MEALFKDMGLTLRPLRKHREAMLLPDRFIAPGSVSRWGVRMHCEGARRCDPTTIGQSVRSAVAQVDPLVPVAELRPMSALVDRATAATRFAQKHLRSRHR